LTLPKVFQWYAEDFHIPLSTSTSSLSSHRKNSLKRRSTSSLSSEHSHTSSDSNSDSNTTTATTTTTTTTSTTTATTNLTISIINTTNPLGSGSCSQNNDNNTTTDNNEEENLNPNGKQNHPFLKLLKQFITQPPKSDAIQQLLDDKDSKLLIQFFEFNWEPTYWTEFIPNTRQMSFSSPPRSTPSTSASLDTQPNNDLLDISNNRNNRNN
jgi:hypothetical protein